MERRQYITSIVVSSLSYTNYVEELRKAVQATKDQGFKVEITNSYTLSDFAGIGFFKSVVRGYKTIPVEDIGTEGAEDILLKEIEKELKKVLDKYKDSKNIEVTKNIDKITSDIIENVIRKLI